MKRRDQHEDVERDEHDGEEDEEERVALNAASKRLPKGMRLRVFGRFVASLALGVAALLAFLRVGFDRLLIFEALVLALNPLVFRGTSRLNVGEGVQRRSLHRNVGLHRRPLTQQSLARPLVERRERILCFTALTSA